MNPTSFTSSPSDVRIAEEMVRSSLSRFENAVDDLVKKVEDTNERVQQAEPYFVAAIGFVCGFVMFKLAHRLIT